MGWHQGRVMTLLFVAVAVLFGMGYLNGGALSGFAAVGGAFIGSCIALVIAPRLADWVLR